MSRRRQGMAVIILLLSLLLLNGCTSCQAPQAEVSQVWDYVPEDKASWVGYMPLADGRVLAATRNGDVYAVDNGGSGKRLVKGGEVPTRVIFNHGGDTFGTLRSDSFTVYDSQGIKLLKLPNQPGAYKLVPPGTDIYSPKVQEKGPELRTVLSARILDHQGNLKSEWPAPGLLISRLSPQYLLYATETEWIKTTLAGSELWRTPVRIRKVRISRDGTYSLINSAHTSETILYYKEDQLIGTDNFDGPVWNLAISPEGRYTVATSQNALRLYESGQRQYEVKLDLAFTVSVDVNERGEVLVGGQAKDHSAYVMLYDHTGLQLWQTQAAPDDNAWRPEVRFDPTGDRCLVRYKDRLAAYQIERNL